MQKKFRQYLKLAWNMGHGTMNFQANAALQVKTKPREQ